MVDHGRAQPTRPGNAEGRLSLDIAVVGSVSTGKTYLARRYIEGQDVDLGAVGPSVGIDVRIKEALCDGKNITLYLWDTAGQDEIRVLVPGFYRRARGILLVYDVTSRTSFDELQRRYDELKTYARDNIVLAIVGNKIDRPDANRTVSYQEGHEFAQAHDSLFFETSALTGQGVEEAFTQVAKRALQMFVNNPADGPPQTIRLDTPQEDAQPTCWC